MVAGRSAADVSKQLDVRLQAVIVTLQTMLRKHPSLYTIDIVSALKDLQLKTRSTVFHTFYCILCHTSCVVWFHQESSFVRQNFIWCFIGEQGL